MINWSNVTDLAQIPAQANNATSGSFWSVILYMLFIIITLIMMSYGFEISLLVGSFLSLIIGLLLVYSDLISWYTILPFIAIMVFMFLYMTYQKNKM